MAKLRRKVFWDFVVSLPEDGDIAGMQELLDRNPEHREELLRGTSRGVDDGDYSVLRYSTWLCQFDNYQPAKGVVRWLLELGLPADLWTALALEDEAAFRAELAADPSLVNAKHPLFQQPILEMASDHFREILIENGADVSSISNRVLLGDLEGARQMIDNGDFTVDEGQETTELLMHAIGCQQDDFACYLLDRGASASGTDGDGYSPVMMACLWGCVGALRAILARGVDPTVPVMGQSLLTWTVHRSVPRVEIVDLLLKAGVTIPTGRFEGQTLLQTARKRGLDDIVERLVEAKKS